MGKLDLLFTWQHAFPREVIELLVEGGVCRVEPLKNHGKGVWGEGGRPPPTNSERGPQDKYFKM